VFFFERAAAPIAPVFGGIESAKLLGIEPGLNKPCVAKITPMNGE
jgi:hypothetical protein